VKIWTIAVNTLGSFLRDKLIILFCALFICIVLLMMTPMLGMKAMATRDNTAQVQTMVLGVVSAIMYFVSGFGSMLAAWAAADSVATELKTGTVLAVMARPVRRWEFLLGKFVGVMLLMTIYVLLMFGLSYLLAWMGGERIQSHPWVLLAYPLVRYAIFAAIAMLLVTVMHPVLSFAVVAILSIVALIVVPGQEVTNQFLAGLKTALYIVLPSTTLLSEDRFLSITEASLKQTGWAEHLTTIAYGLDYAIVVLLLGMWSFHYRSLKRD
jgi:ABC-type transport system involved in multi-copper enzyme maturation permease subunit